ncbi:MAG TPA: polysaccharide deacetylase family protein [Syntrophomonadaceae bacterium]|nr:polysaccharide deacetylase family protein [Syntrophomonadaceae bacterium]HQA07244.1 polysaccharide deacetylase family protein [Syntrophomonadaceae bacterium]HQE22433.1 polysaccharide deacetylase family protein [Syntrophomonadaceae bacterium]
MKKTICLLVLLLIVMSSGCFNPSQADSEPHHNLATQTTPEPSPDTEVPSEPAPSAPADVTSDVTPVVNPGDSPASQTDTIPAVSKSWYFKPNQNHETPQVNNEIQPLALEGTVYYALPQNAPQIYLTFDEGYEQGYTGQILDILKEHNVPAVFFITGHYLKSQPDLIKRMVAEGHQVANHTYNHPDLSKVSKERFDKELDQLEQEFEQLTGSTMAPFLRPPMGNYSLTTLQWAKERNYKTVFWSMAFHDWDPNDQPGADFSHRYVTEHIHPGAIILLHAVSESNTQALPRIIEDLRAAGYVFAPLPE